MILAKGLELEEAVRRIVHHEHPGTACYLFFATDKGFDGVTDPVGRIIVVVVHDDPNVSRGGLVGPVSQKADGFYARAISGTVPNREAPCVEGPAEDLVRFGLVGGG